MSALMDYEFAEALLSRDYCLAVLRFVADVKDVSFYDASYHVLALQTNGTYITADKVYFRKAQRNRHIVLLSEWTL